MAVGIALVIARWLHIDLGGLWVVLSTVIILKPAFADAIAIARDQLVGTAAGVSFGAVFGLMHHTILGAAFAVFLTALVCGTVPMLRRTVNVACIAAAIVILLPFAKPSYMTALDRFVDAVIGAAVALLVVAFAERTYRWWPGTS